MATKTLSIRIDEDDYRFLATMAEEEKEDVSKTVRELVELGRLHLAMDKYRSSEASLEKSARIAGNAPFAFQKDTMAQFRCSTCNRVYEDYYPPDDICLKCKRGTVNRVTSGRYVLSTKTVDNPVEAVDMFQNCHI